LFPFSPNFFAAFRFCLTRCRGVRKSPFFLPRPRRDCSNRCKPRNEVFFFAPMFFFPVPFSHSMCLVLSFTRHFQSNPKMFSPGGGHSVHVQVHCPHSWSTPTSVAQIIASGSPPPPFFPLKPNPPRENHLATWNLFPPEGVPVAWTRFTAPQRIAFVPPVQPFALNLTPSMFVRNQHLFFCSALTLCFVFFVW